MHSIEVIISRDRQAIIEALREARLHGQWELVHRITQANQDILCPGCEGRGWDVYAGSNPEDVYKDVCSICDGRGTR